MICSLFNFCPQSAQSRGHWGALVGLAPQNKAPSPPIWNMIHYKSVEFLSIYRMSSPPIENFPATVLSLLLNHLLSTRSPILPKWNKSLNTYMRSVMVSPKLWVGQNVWFCLRYCLLKHKMTRCSKNLEGPCPLPWLRLCACGLYNVHVMQVLYVNTYVFI